MQLILASTSPRRRELLATLGLSFDVRPGADVNEAQVLAECTHPLSECLEHLARLKGVAAAAEYPRAVVLSADTVVEIEGDLLGKPADAADARTMLTRLSGREHRVHTGVAVQRLEGGVLSTGCETTRVFFAELKAEKIARYVARAEPMDKAGAYAIQGLGALLVERIDGDYSNVVGLPLRLTARLLSAAGVGTL
jgi:septum formation protein